MGIYKIQKELIELTSLETHPSRSFSSGSQPPNGEFILTEKNGHKIGVTGSISLVPRPSPVFKDFPQGIFTRLETETRVGETITTEPYAETEDFVGISPYEFATAVKRTFPLGEVTPGDSISGSLYQYVGMAEGELNEGPQVGSHAYSSMAVAPPAFPGIVNARDQPARNRKKKEIKIFRPPYRLESLGQRPNKESDTYSAPAGTLVKDLSGSHRLLKDYVRKVLMPKNANRYTDSQFAYKNYHTLNFFTGSGFPDGACLIYNNSTGAIPPMLSPFGLDHPSPKSGWDKLPTHWSRHELTYRSNPELPTLRAGRGPYTPTASFTFEFYINPRYTNDHTGDVEDGVFITSPFRAGTIMHMPTVFAVSLVAGSSVDASGLTDGYRIMLQLSHSAEIRPKSVVLEKNSNVVTTSNEPQHADDLIFVSDDNSLKRNHWHYVGIRWGTERVNHGTGTFIIDGEDKGTFYVPSMSIAPQLPLFNMGKTYGATPTETAKSRATKQVERTALSIAEGAVAKSAEEQKGVPDPDILVIGNFYEGPGTGSLCPQTERMFNFFNLTASLNEGVRPVVHNKAGGVACRDDFAETKSTRAKASSMKGGLVPGTDPTDFYFLHQLNAEIHEIKIYDKYRTLEDIITGSIKGPQHVLEYSRSHAITADGGATITGGRHVPKAKSEDSSLLFYLPPFFVKESPNRSFLLNCVQSFKKDGDAAKGWGYAEDGTTHGLAIGPGSAIFGDEDKYGYSKAMGTSSEVEYLYPDGLTAANVYRNDSDLTDALAPLGETVTTKLKPDELGVEGYTFLYTYHVGHPLAFNSGTMLGRPFNAGLSFSVDASIINLENFCREFIGGPPALVSDFYSEPCNYQQGNYPRIMMMTASSLAQKEPTKFNRYNLNIGRLNNLYLEKIHGAYPSLDDYPFLGYTAEMDGKFLTHVSGALQHLYATGSIVRRNLAILPNDNGLFAPNFGWLLSGSMTEASTDVWIPKKPTKIEAMSVFVDDEGNLDLSLIGLQDLFDRRPALKTGLGRSIKPISEGGFERGLETSFLTGTHNYNNSAFARGMSVSPDNSSGGGGGRFSDHVTPDNPDGWAINHALGTSVKPCSLADKTPRAFDEGVIEGSYDFWIYQTTGDPSSNEIKLIDVSNLFYGQRIDPGTFRVRDPFYTCSRGNISITLRDDGQGGLYRADCLTKQAHWANVGNIFYDEGVGIIKSPHIAHFGEDYFDCDFAGKQNVHIMTVNAFAPASSVNSSSNPSYLPLSATLNANDSAPEFTYVTSVNLHDENFNVLMRANLAQPITKRWVEEYLIKIKMDF